MDAEILSRHLPEGFAALTFWVAGIGFVVGLIGFFGVAWWRGWLR